MRKGGGGRREREGGGGGGDIAMTWSHFLPTLLVHQQSEDAEGLEVHMGPLALLQACQGSLQYSLLNEEQLVSS